MTEHQQLKQAIIDRDIERATHFLRALSTVPAIRRIVVQIGYTPDVHQEGWGLLLTLLGYTAPGQELPTPEPNPQQQAIAELDLWDGPNFTRARAALEHLYPDQARYIFSGLAPTTGAAAVGSVKTFLDRAAALRDGTDADRAGSRDADTKAVACLAQRNIVTPDSEADLRKLIETAIELAPEPVDADHTDAAAYQDTARELHAWLSDWRESARAAVSRRDYLIRLGLAQRRRSVSTSEPVDPDSEASDVEPDWHRDAHVTP